MKKALCPECRKPARLTGEQHQLDEPCRMHFFAMCCGLNFVHPAHGGPDQMAEAECVLTQLQMAVQQRKAYDCTYIEEAGSLRLEFDDGSSLTIARSE